MHTHEQLVHFFNAIKGDYRIRNIHIAIFSALLVAWVDKGTVNPLHVYSRDMLQVLKITKATTYCKCLSELSEYGYLTYVPSFKCKKR